MTKWYEKKTTKAIASSILAILLVVLGALLAVWLAPKTVRAKLTNLKVDTNVTLKQYLEDPTNVTLKNNLEDPSQPTKGFSPEELDQNGYLIHFEVELEGLKDRDCVASWSVYDADSKSRIELPDPWVRFQKPIIFTPEAQVDSAAEYFWVPPIDKRHAFLVRIEILDDKGSALTFAETEPIKIKRALGKPVS